MPMFVPLGVIYEILTHVPVKSLARLQLVCKDWRAIIHERYFQQKQMDLVQVFHHWHYRAFTNNEGSSNSTPERLRISYIDGLDGLVLMTNLTTNKIFIWNPATERVLELPDPHEGNYGFAFCYVPVTNSYRIISVYSDKESGRECCEVFTPGQSETWRHLTFPDNVSVNWQIKRKRVQVISSGSDVHCLLSVTVDGITFREIVSLDLINEVFVVNSVKKSIFEDWTRVCAIDWDGKLGFADVNGENLEVMELEDYRKQRWCGKKIVTHLPFMKNNGEEVNTLSPLFAKQGDIWFSTEGFIFSYNNETKWRIVVNGESVANKNYPYKPSLVSLEGMQPQDPRLQGYRPRF